MDSYVVSTYFVTEFQNLDLHELVQHFKSRSSAIVLNLDLAPTMLHIAGVNAPLQMDGLSILPVLVENTSEETNLEESNNDNEVNGVSFEDGNEEYVEFTDENYEKGGSIGTKREKHTKQKSTMKWAKDMDDKAAYSNIDSTSTDKKAKSSAGNKKYF